MKKFLASLLMLMSVSANATGPIGTIGATRNLTIGGQIFTNTLLNDGPPIVLYGIASSSNNYGSARLLNGTAGYHVTAGKTFTVVAVKVGVDLASSGGIVTIGYGDTDVGLNMSSTPPTNPIYLGGQLSNQIVPTGIIGLYEVGGLNFTIPATKIPFIQVTSGEASVLFFGYEN